MNPIFDWLFNQYSETPSKEIILEIVAVIFGLLSVIFAKKGSVKVYPLGIFSTVIFVYLLWINGLFGDMIINVYYTLMSIYGWCIWANHQQKFQVKISMASPKDWIVCLSLAFMSIIFVTTVYYFKPYINNGFSMQGVILDMSRLNFFDVADILTTAIFFVGMWLMARRKIENWIFWIVGDFISVPLYYYKGLIFSSLQYVIFTIIAILAYREWKQIYWKQHIKI